jgi:prophage regulatory protein
MSAKTKAATDPETPARTYPERMLGNKDLRAMFPFGSTCQFEMEKRGEFPKRIAVSPRRSAWLLSEVMAWINEKATERATGPRPLNSPPVKTVTPVKPARRSAARGKARA